MESLAKNLAAMIEAHSQLLDLAKQKRKILIAGSSDELQKVVIRENSCINEIQKLELSRETLVQEYMTQSGRLGLSFTLKDCIETIIDADQKAILTNLAKELCQLIQELSHINESNQQLIQTSLSYIQYSIGMHVRQEPAIGYGPNAGKRYSSFLDAKV